MTNPHFNLTFFVPGLPSPQGSKNAYRRGQKIVLVESSKKVKPWRDTVSQVARFVCKQPIDGAVTVVVHFVMPRTKAMRNKPAPPMVQKPDLDKMLRAVNDALTGIAYADDSQIVRLTGSKRRAAPGEQTGAHITITPFMEDAA